MSPRQSSTRIGNAERDAAQRALHEHLSAGRLQVNEYAERTARAAEATVASEIAALFTDLPAPRPTLPGATNRRNLIIAGAAVLVLAGLALVVGVGVGGGTPPTPPPPAPTTRAAPAVPTTTTALRPTTSAAPTTSPGGAIAAPVPAGVEVRRTTGTEVITLRPSYGVDLDNNTSPNWAVAATGAGSGRDVAPSSNGDTFYFTGDFAVVTGAPEYATCARETGYMRGGIELGSLQPDDNICLRTDQNRYALVTIVTAAEQAIQFRAVVWDPVIAS